MPCVIRFLRAAFVLLGAANCGRTSLSSVEAVVAATGSSRDPNCANVEYRGVSAWCEKNPAEPDPIMMLKEIGKRNGACLDGQCYDMVTLGQWLAQHGTLPHNQAKFSRSELDVIQFAAQAERQRQKEEKQREREDRLQREAAERQAHQRAEEERRQARAQEREGHMANYTAGKVQWCCKNTISELHRYSRPEPMMQPACAFRDACLPDELPRCKEHHGVDCYEVQCCCRLLYETYNTCALFSNQPGSNPEVSTTGDVVLKKEVYHTKYHCPGKIQRLDRRGPEFKLVETVVWKNPDSRAFNDPVDIMGKVLKITDPEGPMTRDYGMCKALDDL